MAFKSITAAALLCLSASLAAGSLPASAESHTVVLTPKGKQASAIRESLRIYGWAQQAKNTASVDQRSRNNSAGISQKGSGNYGAVIQRGRNNSATLAQNGNNNALAVIQVGRGHTLDASQYGSKNAGIVLQFGR